MRAGLYIDRVFPALKKVVLIMMVFFSSNAYSLVFPDTLHIKPIEIFGKRTMKEGAGVITSSIDSTAMVKALTENLSDLILRNTPIFIKEYGRGAMATASFRGTAPSHTQVLWNGINLSSPMLGMVDFSTIPVYFIDNVTLLHGSGSLSENSGALGGIVKLQNLPDFMNRISGRVLTGIGSYGTQDEMVRLNIGNGKLQSQTRAFYNHSDNDYSFINKLNADIDPLTGKYIYKRVRNENAAYQNYGFLQEFYYKPSGSDLISARYWYQDNSRSLPKLLTNQSGNNSNINRQSETAHRASMEWKNFGKGTLDLQSGLNVQNMNYLLLTKTSGSTDQRAINSYSQSVSSYNKLLYEYNFNETFSVSAGVDADFHKVKSFNAPFDSTAYGYNKSRSEESFFISLNKSFSRKLAVTLLGRQNLIDGHSSPFIPSIGIEYRPFTRNEFYIKSNMARNYHQPSLNDLYYIPGGNSALKPEEGIMADLGTGYKWKIGNNLFNVSLNGYSSKINNWIIWLPSAQGYWVPFNMKKVNASGIEFKTDLNGNLAAFKYQLNCNYAFTRSVNKDDPMNWADDSYGKQLPYIPVHSANVSATLSGHGYHLTWIWNYYSRRYTTTSTDKDSELDVIYPYIMNNLFIGKSFSFHKNDIDIELKVMNLFNEEYRTVLQNMMPGRNYSLLLRYDF